MPRGPPVAAAIVDWKARQCSGALGAVVASAGTLVANLSLRSCLQGSLPSHLAGDHTIVGYVEAVAACCKA